MIDEIWKRNEIDSPCIKLCVLHSKEKICIGCHRTADEIKNWSIYSAEQRKKIKVELLDRGQKFTKRRGGRRRNNIGK